jgi:hypothetical protein
MLQFDLVMPSKLIGALEILDFDLSIQIFAVLDFN